ncbi:hypothetical protein AO067_02435 [Pseudomonas viridiflava ICMP 13104]|uniref:Uncharacterized protein n=1 Tax=Pseudomonas viridiflava ICMP 13104 TaxID=1198305 RepID=A0A0W0IAX5_PSEVI|nr:hypothetical protein AO067_02435 [Pseudomonas viridiflava ICMP 13104]
MLTADRSSLSIIGPGGETNAPLVSDAGQQRRIPSVLIMKIACFGLFSTRSNNLDKTFVSIVVVLDIQICCIKSQWLVADIFRKAEALSFLISNFHITAIVTQNESSSLRRELLNESTACSVEGGTLSLRTGVYPIVIFFGHCGTFILPLGNCDFSLEGEKRLSTIGFYQRNFSIIKSYKGGVVVAPYPIYTVVITTKA